MEQISESLVIFDTKLEKLFFESNGSDYCRICSERYLKITGIKRCDCSFKGVRFTQNDYNLEKLKYFVIECINRDTPIKEIGRKDIVIWVALRIEEKLISQEELRKIYE